MGRAEELYCCSLVSFFSRRYRIPPTAALLLYPPVDSVIDRDTGLSCCYIAAVLIGNQKTVYSPGSYFIAGSRLQALMGSSISKIQYEINYNTPFPLRCPLHGYPGIATAAVAAGSQLRPVRRRKKIRCWPSPVLPTPGWKMDCGWSAICWGFLGGGVFGAYRS